MKPSSKLTKNMDVKTIQNGSNGPPEKVSPESVVTLDEVKEEDEILKDLSIFPVDIYPDWVQSYLKEVCEALPCPLDFMGVFLLGTFSAIINNTRKIQIKKSWKETALVYLAIISEPSTLKSPAMDFALEPIYALQEESRTAYNNDLLEFENEFKRVKKKGDKFNKDKPTRVKHFLADTTIEAAARVLNSQKRGFLYVKDELSGWINEMNQYKGKGGSDLAFWLSNWSGKPIELVRVGLEISVASSYVPVMGAIQPDLISTLSSGKRDGFINRVLMSYPKEILTHWTEHDVSDETKDIFIDKSKTICQLLREGDDEEKVLKISPEGLEVWIIFMEDLAEKISNESNSLVKASLSKMKGYTARFALIIQLVNFPQSEVISKSSIESAIRLSLYFIHHMRKTLSVLSGEKTVKTRDEVLEKLKEIKGDITPRTVYKMAGMKKLGYKKTEDVLKLFKQLQEKGFGEIEIKTPEKGGKKYTIFSIYDD